MRKVLMGVLLSAACGVLASPAAYWTFEDGQAGAAAESVSSFVNAAVCKGVSDVFGGKGTKPVYDTEVKMPEVWDGATYALAHPKNERSLRFKVDGVTGSGSPVGGEIVLPGSAPLLQPASFTVEAFVKVAGLTGRHALLISKRRQGERGATWSLALNPEGKLTVRFDTETEANGQKVGQFNQCVNGSEVLADGEWHEVAVSYDQETHEARLYSDYKLVAKGVTPAPLIYDDSSLFLGRGLNGWLDEVRITSEVLHPEQFLRPTRFFADMQKQKQVSYPTFLDQTFTRVQSALDPEMTRIGTLIPKNVHEIDTSMWSLGCETLDRSLADWDAYKGYLEPLGIKRIRLQGGWNRTETKKGEYDFAWLDHIVDDAQARGLVVCLETDYHCHQYEPKGATGPGGGLPEGEEVLAAWDRWVEAMAQRYSAKGVHEWMMYNEPNLRKENTAEKIVANNIRTAEIIKRVDPEAKIGAFVLAGLNVEMIKTMLVQIKEQGKLGLFNWAIYHGYSGNPDSLSGRMAELNAMLAEVAPTIKPWQGEAGCASEEVQYALSGIPWTEYSHAKWNTRRMLCDLGHDVESSVFTISDLAYHTDFISRYGLLKTNPDNGIIKVKTAFYSIQNVVTVFNDALARVPDYPLTVTKGETNLTWYAFRDKKSGLDVITLWDGRQIPSNDSDIERVDLAIKGGHFKEPVWVDLITGNIFEIPAEQMTAEGDTVRFMNVPVYDGPGALTDRSLLVYEKAREKKGAKAKKAKAASKKTDTSPKLAMHLLPGTQQPAPAVLILGPKESVATERLVKWLNTQSVHAFVLDAPDTGKQAVQAAVHYIRSRAAEWQVKADAVGVMSLDGAGANAAREARAFADFAVVISAEQAAGGADRKHLFVGTPDAWEKPLAQWLEAFKSSVF